MSLPLRKSPDHYSEYHIEVADADADENIEYDDGLLAVAGPIMIACYSLFFAIAAFTFFGTGTAFFSVGVSVLFAIVYFAIPMTMMKIRSTHDTRWRKQTSRASIPDVEVWTGSLKRWEAILQIVSVPLAILMGFALLALRWSML
ncbi:hypothetical protein [Hyphomicrobium sp.]|uniref:hypothetical protein n=1 Tax=Hyphomicrobium sp. TaxID=82 RepID=UPI002E373C70|nr:hypothetical protein [Hyphomicrobium sp.]HEX2841070.1 hypothetical protein [Hyphomicrobium sp.]